MSAEGSLKIAGLELPNLDGAVLRTGGKRGVLWMEGECGDVGLMSL